MKKIISTLVCFLMIIFVTIGTLEVFAEEDGQEKVAIVNEDKPIIKGVSKNPKTEGTIPSTRRRHHGGIVGGLIVISGLGMVYLNKKNTDA